MNPFLQDLGLTVVIATILGIASTLIRQPLLIGYLIAGCLLGGKLGYGLIQNTASINALSGVGLILLLFIIGIETNLSRLRADFRAILILAVAQGLGCLALGYAFFQIPGLVPDGTRMESFYLAFLCMISSLVIVAKLLSDKRELDTRAGRLSLGILVVQNLWAIFFLALQPHFENPDVTALFVTVGKTGAFILSAFLISRYLLRAIFHSVSKYPPLVTTLALGWCAVAALAGGWVGISKEMGALIAGISIASFPYGAHLSARVAPLRDFFLTLFFTALGMKLDLPGPQLVLVVILITLFTLASRFISVFPVMRLLKNSRRDAFLVCLNIAQLGAIPLVLAKAGQELNHIRETVFQIFLFSMAFTSVLTSYLIQYNSAISDAVFKGLSKLGLRPDPGDRAEVTPPTPEYPIVLLGYHRVAKALLETLAGKAPALLPSIRVIDINTENLEELRAVKVAALFGDVSDLDTLRKANVGKAKFILSSVPDMILKGTTNERLVRACRELAPGAQILATAASLEAVLAIRDAGADFVFRPHLTTGKEIAERLFKALPDIMPPDKTQIILDKITTILGPTAVNDKAQAVLDIADVVIGKNLPREKLKKILGQGRVIPEEGQEMKTIEDVKKFYDTELLAGLKELEAKRKKVAFRYYMLIFVSIPIVLISLALLPFGIIGIIAVIALWTARRSIVGAEFQKDFKKRIIERLILFMEPGLTYKPEESISRQTFIESQIFQQTPDRYAGDDFVSGSIGQTAISFSEAHAEYKVETRDKNGSTRTQWQTIFRGLFFVADFNKNFRTRTFVLPDVAQRLFGSLGQWLQGLGGSHNAALIKLEDPEFEKYFAVYGDDQIEARYILSMSLMQRICEYRKRTGRAISISFVGRNIYIAVPYTRELFEPRIFGTLLDFAPIREYYEDLSNALDIVGELNLNLRIWGKE